MIIEADSLVKRHEELITLDHFRSEVEKGEILGLLGPNGSGKITAINCMLALLTCDKGDIRIFGKQMKVDSYDLRQQIGVVPQNVVVFRKLSVEDDINYFCGLHVSNKAKRKTLVDETMRFVSSERFREFRPGKLNGSLLRGLNIACGIAHQPKLIFIGEPAVAADPRSRDAILEGIRCLGVQGATIVYTSHCVEEVGETCSRIIIIDKGKTITAGSGEGLKAGIMMKEKVKVEQVKLQEQQVQGIQDIANVFSVQYNANVLQVKFTERKYNLANLLDYFTRENITYGRVYSQQPTLNDVFLEITGKQLRD